MKITFGKDDTTTKGPVIMSWHLFLRVFMTNKNGRALISFSFYFGVIILHSYNGHKNNSKRYGTSHCLLIWPAKGSEISKIKIMLFRFISAADECSPDGFKYRDG